MWIYRGVLKEIYLEISYICFFFLLAIMRYFVSEINFFKKKIKIDFCSKLMFNLPN